MDTKLRIGRIPYANLFPLFYVLERELDSPSYEFVEGVPSVLNRMLRTGEVDLSPSSSVEYLRNPDRYFFIDNHSVSSKGAVGSIFLFSRKPLGELDGSGIAVTSQSETSVVLLEIILTKFHGIRCPLRLAALPARSGEDAFLLIGDEALRYSAENRRRGGGPGGLLQYDLGEIWYERTGLPFVFALWIVRRQVRGEGDAGEKGELFARFVKDLDTAKKRALERLPDIARHSPLRGFLSREEILAYWKRLDYELDGEHRKGLALFDRYRQELSPCPAAAGSDERACKP